AVLLLDNEGEHEPEQGERLDERDTKEHRGPDHAGRLGLSSHRLDRLAHEEDDTDPGTDGDQAVHEALADGRADVRRRLCEKTEQVRHVVPPPSARGGWPRRGTRRSGW